MQLYLSVFTPQQSRFAGKVDSVSLPGTQAPFQVLAGHASLQTTLTAGTLSYAQQGKQQQLQIPGGIAEVHDDTIVVLTSA